MLYQAKAYLKFLLRSTNQHGVHSPFVYDLVTRCFYDKTNYPQYKAIQSYRKGLLKLNEVIDVTDLGAGSQVMHTKKRHVKTIAKNAGTTNNRAKLLFRLVKHFKPYQILELGTSLGIGTNALRLANPDSKITSIEGCSNTAHFSSRFLKTQGITNVHIMNHAFDDALKHVNSQKFDLVFFDGNHQKETTLNYFETLLPTIHNNSVFIFDDIYWSKGMTEAWDIIKKHPKVTVSIDTFFWGIVFFRKEQVKEHFTIRV